ncbi:S24 family peptidase [uncultured Xylophilus sp.]|uniref:S24 family peptidase n=1 Tax=uncultured Xylophilus sp. TaxID=296832 RepID=UPI0025CEF1EC|nr:S24 family peptidase [uncultured Xylophilus sp.]
MAAPNAKIARRPNATLATNMRTLMGDLSIGALRERMAGAGYAIGQGTIDRVLKGDDGVRLESLRKIAEYFDVTLDNFLQIELGRQNETPVDQDFVAVRRADVKFSNGEGRVVYQEDDRPPLVFRSDFLRKLGIAPGNALVVDAAGVSNEPKIADGAVVLVNRGDRERLDGDFFAFRVDGNLLIKRLELLEGAGIVATAENPNFKPKMKIYSNEDDFEVIGRAVWTGSVL